MKLEDGFIGILVEKLLVLMRVSMSNASRKKVRQEWNSFLYRGSVVSASCSIFKNLVYSVELVSVARQGQESPPTSEITRL